MISVSDIQKIAPLFSISSTILNTKLLIDSGIEPTLTELLLPSLVMTYGPPLFANSLYSRYEMTLQSVSLYAIGFILSIFIYSNNFLMFFIEEVPYISKLFSLVKLKNSTEDTFSMMSWVISRDIARICIRSLVLRKRLRMKTVDMLSMAVAYGGMLFLRKYGLRDYYVIVVAGIAPLTIKAIESIRECKSEQKGAVVSGKTSQQSTPISRVPRRRASVSTKLVKKE